MKEIDEILQAAANHPNSRVSKLIRTVEEEPSQKNIVLLLVELAEHSEFATDFRISLKYYLELFEHLGIGHGTVLNETGVLLINSSKIYAKRVDYVQELVEHQIITLSSAEHEKENALKNDEQSPPAAEKPKKGRKRMLKTISDPYEVELIPKKFRKLTNEKRFSTSKQPPAKIMNQRNIEQDQHLHPAAWVHSCVVDLENEEEIDSKRNYKLFTYHVEHRYNTLVPDINFRLHFKVKDYIDEEEERIEEERGGVGGCLEFASRVWPPLSEEYVEKYISVENHVLEEDIMPQRKRLRIDEITEKKQSRRKSEDDFNDAPLPTNALDQVQTTLDAPNSNTKNGTVQNDSGLGQSLLDSSKANDADPNNTNREEVCNSTALYSADNSLNITASENSTISNNESSLSASTLEKSLNESTSQIDSAIGESIISLNQTENAAASSDLSSTKYLENGVDLSGNAAVDGTRQQNSAKTTDDEFSLNDIRILMPGHDDEGVYFSDLDEQEQMKLSPNVVFVDYFSSIPNKKDITIILNEDMKAMLNLPDDDPPITYELPEMLNSNSNPPLKLNIFKIQEKLLRRRVLFKLGPNMDLFLKARALKRPRNIAEANEQRQTRSTQWYPLNSTDMTGVVMTPPRSSGDESDFYGFTDDEESQDFLGFGEQDPPSVNDNAHRLSSDSGVGVDVPLLTTQGCGNLESILEEELEGKSDAVDNVQASKATGQDLCADNVENNKEKSTEHFNTSVSGCLEKSNNENEVKANNDATEKDTTAQTSTAEYLDEPYVDDDDESDEVQLMDLDLQSNKTKIQKWHEHLQPILAKSRERHHFDVFEIGTEIIEEIQNPSSNAITFSSNRQSSTFQNVMENKNESYVSRYFLSALLLANQSNIKITVNNQSSEEPSTLSDIKFDLLSTKRHTVAIEDNIGMVKATVMSPSKNDKRKATTITENASISAITATATATENSHNAKRLQLDSDTINVNLNVVRPLKQIEKLPRNSDDYDSGVFSCEEFAL